MMLSLVETKRMYHASVARNVQITLVGILVGHKEGNNHCSSPLRYFSSGKTCLGLLKRTLQVYWYTCSNALSWN